MKNAVATLALAIGVFSPAFGSAHGLAPGAVPHYKFRTQDENLATGGTVSAVILEQSDEGAEPQDKVMLDIPNKAGGLSASARAETIRQRAQRATSESSDWYEHLQCKIDKKSGEWVITSPLFEAKNYPLVTVDKDYLKYIRSKTGTRHDRDSVEVWREGILLAFDADAASQMGVGRDLLDNHFIGAVNHMTKGSFFFHNYNTLHNQGNLLDAISEYKQAIDENPHYLSAMQELYQIYKLAGKPEAAARLKTRIDGVTLAIGELNLGNNVLPEKVDGVSTNSANMADIPKLNEAIKHYENAIAAYSGCISFHIMLSDCYQTIADIQRSNGHLAEATRATDQEKQVLAAIPSEVVTIASEPFKVYVKTRLKALK